MSRSRDSHDFANEGRADASSDSFVSDVSRRQYRVSTVVSGGNEGSGSSTAEVVAVRGRNQEIKLRDFTMGPIGRDDCVGRFHDQAVGIVVQLPLVNHDLLVSLESLDLQPAGDLPGLWRPLLGQQR